MTVGQGRLEEAEPLLGAPGVPSARRSSPPRGDLHFAAGPLDLAHGRYADALAAFQAAEPLAGTLRHTAHTRGLDEPACC